MNGAQAIEAMREDRVTARIPIVMMSGSDDAVTTSRRAGADAFVAKPIDPDILLANIARLVGPARPDEVSKTS
jgi:CheY-like chemotaxis protein